MKAKKHPLIEVINNIDESSCPYNINFHCHTNCSDGAQHPEEIIKNAITLGLEHIAITDHHTIQAFPLIQDWIERTKISTNIPKVWTGIEISCLLKGCLVHILGLGFEADSSFIRPYIGGESVTGKLLRAEEVIKAIRLSSGISILAHPARYRVEYYKLIEESYLLGINGIEVWYDYDYSEQWKPSKYICKSIEEIADRFNLLKTCGTDSHGYSLLSR